ncbi:aminotransferase class I/II-fold pyridoxal phosphate-dependent enzyme, partial [Rhodovulum sp.]|uniref:aminotransferase class I/II-fold pyridoxal phosphate-dependent enzyme n=1 Tax=Rhodovulum sp. TaxID=34009 RepID=UPI0017ADEB9F
MRVSSRGDVDPFIVMDVMAAAARAEAAGRHIIHMEVGQPGTPAPAAARAELAQAMETGPLGYTVGLGLPALRARIARLYGDWYGVDLNPERVVITPGSSGGFTLAFTALFDVGARVGIGAPGYPSYKAILQALGLQTVMIGTEAQHRYQPVPADLPTDLDGLLVASPANP